MKSRITRMGSSRGIRIPKALLEQTGLEGEVEIIARSDTLIIRPIRKVRVGWEQAFAEMARRRDDRLVAEEPLRDAPFNLEDWEWSSTLRS